MARYKRKKVSCFTCCSAQFSLRIRRVTQRGVRRYVPVYVTALTALFICLFQFKNFVIVGNVTLNSNLETLDLLRSSANRVNPGEAEVIAGLVRGSVIPNLGLAASDRASIQITVRPAVLPYGQEHHRLALGYENPPRRLDMLLGFAFLWVVSHTM